MNHKAVILIVLVFSLVPIGVSAQENPQIARQTIRAPALLEGWQYRWGDSPLDENGIPKWVFDDESSSEWNEISSMVTPPGARDQNYAWYRTRLPEDIWRHPTIYFPTVAVSFEAYLDAKLIYKFGKMEQADSNKYAVVTDHLIALQDEFQGKMLVIRVYSPVAGMIGLSTYEAGVWIGAENDLIKKIFQSSAGHTALGILFIFVGLFSAIFSATRFRRQMTVLLSFGSFAFFIGAFFVFLDPIANYLVESNALKLYARFLSFLIFPVGLYIFLQQITGPHKAIRLLWMAHLVVALIVLSLDMFRVVSLPLSFTPYSAFFACTILIAVSLAIKAAIHGNQNAKIFVWGFTALGLTGLNDILIGLGYIPFWRFMSHWGTLVFILCLVYVLQRILEESHIRLQVYSEELERKSGELIEYSNTLEQRVADRTKDLDVKNKELENTLVQLQETQQQLIIKEKMAALGDLVAGVAHEMNNPIGAINSASDVSSRCLDRLQETVEKGGSVEAILNNKRYQTAMELLRENTRIAVEGSGRVTTIIRSLKNFARLDEAELKEADLHEGIESTLTLVHHELKNRIEVVKKFGDIPMIRCYPNQLNQVFMNLFVNAAHAIEGKGTMTITTNSDGKNVMIRVADDGSGIQQEHIERIFDPGFTTKGVGVGTGLGLSISYSIIQKHRGTLRVESEVGQGTEFIISLPV